MEHHPHTDANDLQALERLVTSWRVEDQRALALQAIEYERRLTELNHAHQRNEQRNAEFVSLAVFDAAVREQRITATDVLKMRSELSSTQKDHTALASSITWLTRLVVGALVVGLVGVVFQALKVG